MESARAPLDYRHLLSLVTPTAAHQVATINADARVVTLSPVSTQDAEFGILLAEWRRRLHVDQILLPGRLMLRIVWLQLEIVALPTSETITMLMHGVTRRVAGDGIVGNARSV